MEEKIYDRQITKLAVAGRVVDEQQIERHFTEEEIRELYTFAPEKVTEGAETPQLPKVRKVIFGSCQTEVQSSLKSNNVVSAICDWPVSFFSCISYVSGHRF